MKTFDLDKFWDQVEKSVLYEVDKARKEMAARIEDRIRELSVLRRVGKDVDGWYADIDEIINVVYKESEKPYSLETSK